MAASISNHAAQIRPLTGNPVLSIQVEEESKMADAGLRVAGLIPSWTCGNIGPCADRSCITCHLNGGEGSAGVSCDEVTEIAGSSPQGCDAQIMVRARWVCSSMQTAVLAVESGVRESADMDRLASPSSWILS